MKKLKPKRRKTPLIIQEQPIVRYQTDREHGLSEEQIAERIEHKLTNDTKIRTSNSYLSIVAKNVFTVFNLIWLLIATMLIVANAWGDMLFMVVVVANTAISIFQEIKAKIMVEKLSLVSAPKNKVIRTGIQYEVNSENLLLDDIIILENGNQIPADCVIVEGNVEANESLLTGESNAIKKHEGDTLLAGSFLVSGLCYARIDRVGKGNYIQTVAERTKDFKPQSSNLFKDLNSLIKAILLVLIPLGVLTFCNQYFLRAATLTDAVARVNNSIIKTSGAVTGMIPAGMYLLITVGLSVGVIKLAKKKTLVKNLYSIEMLARSNVLCLDKTGTITDGTMNVIEVLPQNDTKMEQIADIMKTILAKQKTTNATSVALMGYFGKTDNNLVKDIVEFSSSRKYSATTLTNGKTYYIGALGFIKVNVTAHQKNLMNSYMEKGYRVLAFVEDSNPYTEKMAGKRGKLIAFFVLEDHIRKDAVETIAWFKQNDVKIKIISGDDALTVSKIAKRVGVEDSDKFISLENMSLQEVAQIADKFTVFGRVTPEQKHTIIKTLKIHGNVVAMTGDGVNDTLALKEANCSIAMADGSEVARNISHLVLMESNFSALPAIVKEGRQIVNNVQNSSVLYIMKTLFTIIMCATALVLRTEYPFAPRQLLLLEMFVIGIPSFILTFQPNSELIKGNFIPQVLKKSIPCALLMYFNMLIIVILNDHTNSLTPEEFTSLSTMLLTFIGYINLIWICWPANWLRALCILISGTLIVSALSGLGRFFLVSTFSFPVMTTLVTLLLCSIAVLVAVYYFKGWLLKVKPKPAGGVEKTAEEKPSFVQKFLNLFKSKETESIDDLPEEPKTEQTPPQQNEETAKEEVVSKKTTTKTTTTKTTTSAKTTTRKATNSGGTSKKTTTNSGGTPKKTATKSGTTTKKSAAKTTKPKA